MTKLSVEITVDARGQLGSDPRVPEALFRYARAMMLTSRDSMRFLWRNDATWLAVTISRDTARHQKGDGHRTRAVERSTLRIAEITLPMKITSREVDVLTLTALGLTNQGVAERLGTSVRTVSTQMERLLLKLGQTNRGGLAALAVDLGLLRLPIPGGVGKLEGLGIVELERAVLGYPLQPVSAEASYPRRSSLKIGTLIPGGVASADGNELRRGAELAVEEVNAMGGVSGRRLELVTAEVDIFDWSDISAKLEHIFDSEVDAITTSYTSVLHSQMFNAIADFGRPLLHTATAQEQVDLVREDPLRYGAIFQTCPSEVHYGAGLLRLFVELEARQKWQPKHRRLAVVQSEAAGMSVATDHFYATVAKAGWKCDEAIRVPLTATDWSVVMAKLAILDPDVIMVAHILDRELLEFHQALVASGLRAIPYYVYAASIPRFQSEAGSIADGVIWSTTTGTYDDMVGQSFRQRFKSRFGVLPGWAQAGSSYDQIHLLTSAWAATNSRDPQEVARYLRNVPQRGVNGVYFLGSEEQASLSYPDTTPNPATGQAHMIYQIQGSTHRVLGPEPFGLAEDFVMPSWLS